MHAGLQRPDGIAAPGLTQASQVAKELKQFSDIDQIQSKVALVFDYESCWAWEVQPQGRDFSYFNLVYDYYRALRALGLSIDILSPYQKDLSDYKIVLMPGLMRLNETLELAIESFKGILITGPRTGSKTPNMHIPKQLPPIIPGIKGTVSSVESLRPNASVSVTMGGKFNCWVESLVDCNNIIEYCDDGRPAIIGQSDRQYIAGWPDQDFLIRIFSNACTTQKISATLLPSNVRVRETRSHRFWFNYSESESIVGGIKLPPSGVIWESL
jgi:beta-galactosidase